MAPVKVSELCTSYPEQGCRKQSPDGQVQLDVGGEAAGTCTLCICTHAKSQIFTSARDRLRLDRDERVTARPQCRRQRE